MVSTSISIAVQTVSVSSMSSGNPGSLYVIFTVLISLVLISTLLRLSFRLHIQRFWWEDAWAAAAFVSGTAFVIAQCISVVHASPEIRVITCWILTVFSTITMCAVRLSILYSIIRIMSPSSRIHTFARIVAICVFIFGATSVALRSALCTNHIALMGTHPVKPKCLDRAVLVIFQVTTDCISDAILVTLSLKFLWRVKLPRRQRRMILTSFASSAIVSIFSLAHGVSQALPNDHFEYNLTLNLETMSALIVCNLLVLVTYTYRLFRKSRGGSVSFESESDDSSADDDFTTRAPARSTTEVLTTVDLAIDATYSGVTSSVSSSSHSRSAALGKNEV